MIWERGNTKGEEGEAHEKVPEATEMAVYILDKTISPRIFVTSPSVLMVCVSLI